MRSTMAAILVGLALSLAGCGGSVDSASGGGSSATVSQGVITGIGSIFVNGCEFITTSATVRIDDNPKGQDDLKKGMIVTVNGSCDDNSRIGNATHVEARKSLEGQIQNVNAGAGTITVMGQTVQIENNVTRLNDDDTLKVFAQGGFQAGQFVQVNGFPDDKGGLRATRVARLASAGEFETKGFVTGLGATSFGLSLTAGGTRFVTVNFTPPLQAGVANGSFVEVKASGSPVSSQVTATLIHLEDRVGAAGQDIEVEGIVTGGTVDHFFLNGGREVFTVAGVTRFEGGTRNDFVVGIKLEAEGPVDANGAIQAEKVSYRSNIRIEANTTNVNATSITVLGKVAAINPLTRVDGTPTIGSHVEVRGMLDNSGGLIATRIIVANGGNTSQAFLQGPVTAADSVAGTVTLVGSTVNSNGSTEWRLSNKSTETPVDKATFFSRLNVNVTVVKVKWSSFVSLSDPIKEAEIEIGD